MWKRAASEGWNDIKKRKNKELNGHKNVEKKEFRCATPYGRNAVEEACDVSERASCHYNVVIWQEQKPTASMASFMRVFCLLLFSGRGVRFVANSRRSWCHKRRNTFPIVIPRCLCAMIETKKDLTGSRGRVTFWEGKKGKREASEKERFRERNKTETEEKRNKRKKGTKVSLPHVTSPIHLKIKHPWGQRRERYILRKALSKRWIRVCRENGLQNGPFCFVALWGAFTWRGWVYSIHEQIRITIEKARK